MTDGKATHLGIASAVARRYLLAVLAGILGSCALFIALLAALNHWGHLPPPAFANSLCADEKLRFLRDRPVASPNLLVIGSSVAWRHIDSGILAEMLPGTKPLNAGFCGLTANQSVFVAHWMLDRYADVRHVLLVVAPQDLTRCRKTRSALFDRKDADSFVYQRASTWPYYFRYFDPVSLVRSAFTIKDRRNGQVDFDVLVFDAYGDGPLDTQRTRELGYEEQEPLDPACFDALRSLTERLEREGRTLSIVTTPLNPDWLAQEGSRATFVEEANNALLLLSRQQGLSYWNAATEWKTPTASFTDAIHLRWSAAQTFTAAVAQHLFPPSAPAREGEAREVDSRVLLRATTTSGRTADGHAVPAN